LQNIAKNFGVDISPEIYETMSFVEQDPVTCESVVDDKCLLQVRNFKYLGWEISYEGGKHIQQKVAKFAQILGIPNNATKPTLVQKL
jgi:hypothetical protein